MAKIKMKNSVTVAETFHDFLTAKKAAGVSEKTLLTYGQHFSAVSKHLSPDTPMDGLNKADLDSMIASMRDAGLAANSIKSYTRTLKSFLSWCNEAGITRLNIQLYKAEETIKEGENFRALIDLCFSYADKFSLRRCGWPGEHDGALEQALRPFCVGEYLSYSTRIWFEKEHREKCYLYLATEETKNILLRHIHHLFGTEESLAPDGHEKYLQKKYAAYHQAETKADEQVTAYMDHMGPDSNDDDVDTFMKETYRKARELWLQIFDETDYYSTMEIGIT